MKKENRQWQDVSLVFFKEAVFDRFWGLNPSTLDYVLEVQHPGACLVGENTFRFYFGSKLNITNPDMALYCKDMTTLLDEMVLNWRTDKNGYGTDEQFGFGLLLQNPESGNVNFKVSSVNRDLIPVIKDHEWKSFFDHSARTKFSMTDNLLPMSRTCLWYVKYGSNCYVHKEENVTSPEFKNENMDWVGKIRRLIRVRFKVWKYSDWIKCINKATKENNLDYMEIIDDTLPKAKIGIPKSLMERGT